MTKGIGNTDVADAVDNEPRFFKHALLPCSRGDLLLLDLQVKRGSPLHPMEIQKRDEQLRLWTGRADAVADSTRLCVPLQRTFQERGALLLGRQQQQSR